jgi:hypothetical protein
MSHSAGPGSELWATARDLVLRYGPQRGNTVSLNLIKLRFQSETNRILCVSLCTWPCIHPRAPGQISMCKWSWIYCMCTGRYTIFACPRCFPPPASFEPNTSSDLCSEFGDKTGQRHPPPHPYQKSLCTPCGENGPLSLPFLSVDDPDSHAVSAPLWFSVQGRWVFSTWKYEQVCIW